MTTPPAGPWVLVIGCHRSGTSAITGALAALGLHGVDAADRMDPTAGNAEHWESLGLSVHDEDLLSAVGASWDGPPPVGDPQPPAPVGDDAEELATLLAAAYPEPGPAVWKDPRACLLLDYWRAVLPGPLTAMFVWREPLAVARSLQTRDGIPLADGLALWERYNRAAAAGLQGVDTYVLDYGSVVDDASAALTPVVEWLSGLDRFAPSSDSWDVERAVAAIDVGLRHESATTDDVPDGLLEDCWPVVSWLVSQDGGHTAINGEPPASRSPWPEALLATRRQLGVTRRTVEALMEDKRQLDARIAAMEADRVVESEARRTVEALLHSREDRLRSLRHELDGERMRYEGMRAELERTLASTSWKVTKPLRAVVGEAHKLLGD